MTTLDKINIIDHHENKVEWEIKKDACKLYDALKIHANGEIPKVLIERRRPNEPDEIKQYRFDIYAPVTEQPITKVFTSLSKIRRSNDYKVDYSKAEQISFSDETLEDYLEYNYPVYDNLDSWLFDECLQNILIDANAVCALIPLKFKVDATELIKPIPYIANVDDVIFYKEEDYTIFKTDRDIFVLVDNVKTEFDIYILSTRNEIIEYYIYDGGTQGKQVREINRFTHSLNELQAFRFRGMFYKNEDGDIIWKSPINPMVTHLNEAAREYSDLQAEKVLHIFSEKWVINTNSCSKCEGRGKVKGAGFNSTAWNDCPSCKGTGFDTVTPFRQHTVNVDLAKPNSQIPPIPPAGYIQKDTAITKILEESVNKHLYKSLESINMQFLSEVPMSESGIAKEWDRDETDSFAFKVASLLKYVRENVAYYTNEMRYYFIVPNKEQREKALPIVIIPQKYDLVTNQVLIDEYKKAKEANISPSILAEMENEIALKRFSHNSYISSFTGLVFSLDPLYCISEDDKVMRLQNKGIEEKDYIVSSNIHKFIRRALVEDKEFAEKEYAYQLSVINGYADEVLSANEKLKIEVVN